MKAWLYAAAGATPQLLDLPEPDCPADGVIVEVAATGVCRSDWHAWTGHDPVPLPMIPGHEFAGTVAAVGPEVRRVAVGQRVTAPFALGCGRCPTCRDGDTHVCPHQQQPGFTRDGSFAQRLAVPFADTNVIALPDAVGFEAGAALGCRFATSYRALTAVAGLRPGEWLAVFGCGGVGLSAVQIAVALGARVLAVDASDAALRRAVALGAEQTLRTRSDPSDESAIVEITGGGADVGLDAVGDPAVAALSIRSLRRRGRHVQVGLLLDQLTPLPMGPVVSRELTIRGSHGMPAADYPGLLDLVSAGRLRPQELIGRRIPLDEAGPALTELPHRAGHGLTMVLP